ncbi:HhH-GDP family DNA glycosylase [Dactylosporangium darangshiense]|uniref:Endonuclease n=1 Tax=Dactylosporangium darangshiense TaxID=579108 RepID=A0ABP8DF08_9ACTN
MSTRDRHTVAVLLEQQGRTFAEEAGIRLADKPAPLYQLLVLSTLLSAPITSVVGIGAARELFATGYRTPRAMLQATWQDRVDALGRGHYRRYDERTATILADGAELCLSRWGGDLRRLHADAGAGAAGVRDRLTDFPGIGPTGADIFVREVQAVWADVAPFVDRRVTAGAERLHLPSTPEAIARLAERRRLPELTAALVRVGRDRKAADAVLAA